MKMISLGRGKEQYSPTVEELTFIRKANEAFLFTYGLGIVTGLIAGFSLSRVTPFSKHKTATIFCVGLTGEYGGRKLGETRAQQYLRVHLPAGSVLRELMGEKAGRVPATVEYGLEGTRAVSQEVGGGEAPAVKPVSQSAWATVRRENAQMDTTAWGRIRAGKKVGGDEPVVSLQQQRVGGGEEADDLFGGGGGDLEEGGEEGRVVTGAGGGSGEGQMRPRTREEQEEWIRQGKLRRNKFGDFE
ncbi:hypothetical protein HDU98_000249 [Podochytrium sp. JEL0797]|nr:hypothetical protein HDU98_000249 [Podochytrium sp. JEL0797]